MPPANEPDALQQAMDDFRAIGGGIQRQLRIAGEFLRDRRGALTESEFIDLRKWIASEFGVTLAAQTVWERVANGEIHEDMACKVPASKLASAPADRIPQPDEMVTIVCPENRVTIEKRAGDMTVSEIRRNFTTHGLQRVNEQRPMPEQRAYRSAHATTFRVEGRNLILIVPGENLQVSFTLTREVKLVLLGEVQKEGAA